MINKALRIMIADSQHFQRLHLERDFNREGYYCIAPVSSLEEMLTLLEYGDTAFDLVLINASLTLDVRFNLLDFCLDHPLIRQAFIYDVPEHRLARLGAKVKARIVFSSIQRSDQATDPQSRPGTQTGKSSV
ncbi:response regulator [Pseudomonas sp. TH31]|uniref:response regulator n=1 Tax=Pseudomonas sp. TH31 TaxID=2796396 RepID=UPI001911BB14|nr:response regulator [Pseudomonas sp. TH31]MBK5416167.1 response regulator [Pseudomonas sp. TH31]